MFTLNECDETLATGFPLDPDVIQKLPFGAYMLDVVQKPQPGNRGAATQSQPTYFHRDHVCKVMNSMNKLLQGTPRTLVPEQAWTDTALQKWLKACEDILGPHGNALQRRQDRVMWRLEAFLHDVGKSLTPAKHPTRGHYLITELDRDEKERTIEMLGGERRDQDQGKSRFSMIEKVVAFHDRFGVLSTGEASHGILADTIERGLQTEDLDTSKAAISHIMLVNLIDIDASVTRGLSSEKIETVLDDWRHVCWDEGSPLVRSGADRVEFEKLLLERAQKDAMVYARIERLIHQSYSSARDLAEEKAKESLGANWVHEKEAFCEKWPDLDAGNLRPQVRAALKGLEIHWDDFCKDFAHVVKMDYLLYFTKHVVLQVLAQSSKKSDVNREADRLAGIFVRIVQTLVDQFTRLIRQTNSRLRIGIDLSVLRDTPTVQEKIADLVSGTKNEPDIGLRWLAHEASAWPFI